MHMCHSSGAEPVIPLQSPPPRPRHATNAPPTPPLLMYTLPRRGGPTTQPSEDLGIQSIQVEKLPKGLLLGRGALVFDPPIRKRATDDPPALVSFPPFLRGVLTAYECGGDPAVSRKPPRGSRAGLQRVRPESGQAHAGGAGAARRRGSAPFCSRPIGPAPRPSCVTSLPPQVDTGHAHPPCRPSHLVSSWIVAFGDQTRKAPLARLAGISRISPKMMASCAPLSAPLCRPQSHFSSWCSAGILLGALVLPLPVSPSDACGDPLRYESMKLKGVAQRHYSPGATVEYECRLGYQLKRPPLPTSARCQADNTWTPLREACTRKSCPHPGDLINGKVEYVNGTLTFGSQIHYFCNEGFNLIGTKILYCEIVGETVNWSDNPPLCQVMYCRPPPKIQNGKHSRSDQEEFRYGEVVIYSCDPSNGPDEYSLVGESRLVCSGNDVWSSKPPECKVVKCEPPVLKNGRVVSGFGKKFYYKATVVFDCLPGFYLSGNNTIVCGANSAWEPAIPTCIKVMLCRPPPKIENGKHRSDKEEFEYGEVVTYSCDPSNGLDEYSLVGESKLVCSGNDVWSSKPPECKVVKCEYPVLENGGIVSGFGSKFYYKATVVFECAPGFHLSGNNIVVCGANSTWEPAIPKCIKESPPPSTTPPVSSTSGSKPAVTTKPPRVSSSPGHPSCSFESPPLQNMKTLGGGIVAVIVVTLLMLQ
ncbi:complement receptor type 1-like [Equus quagga]|uniref:complement receptor type 1-like n=1 Tax=Equus quagga TaxID=89248 RepID=UPI001EE27D0D|nr:complement receptor type 1-like [Equus quagga]